MTTRLPKTMIPMMLTWRSSVWSTVAGSKTTGNSSSTRLSNSASSTESNLVTHLRKLHLRVDAPAGKNLSSAKAVGSCIHQPGFKASARMSHSHFVFVFTSIVILLTLMVAMMATMTMRVMVMMNNRIEGAGRNRVVCRISVVTASTTSEFVTTIATPAPSEPSPT